MSAQEPLLTLSWWEKTYQSSTVYSSFSAILETEWAKICGYDAAFHLHAKPQRKIMTKVLNMNKCLNVYTTPITAMGFRQCLTFSWTTLRGKHCRHPIAIMEVVDTFRPWRVPIVCNIIMCLIFWHPWHPWVCIRSDLKPLLKQIVVIPPYRGPDTWLFYNYEYHRNPNWKQLVLSYFIVRTICCW